MKNKNVEIEDFLQDEEFVRWVKKPTVEANKYWKAWMEANPENAPVLLQAKELLLSITFSKKIPSQNERDEILHNVVKKLDGTSKSISNPKRSWRNKILPIAASIAVVIGAAYFFAVRPMVNRQISEEAQEINSITIKETPPGIKLQTVLPDGSKVWLNAQSKVSYDQFYGQKDRKVYLEGEAFFEVEKDKSRPFIVQSGGLKITALGTSFNVKSLVDCESSEVALVTGRVEVVKEGENRESVILNPGQKVVHESKDHQLHTSEFSVENEIGWKNGIMVFDNASFDEIKATLERWYGVKIHTEFSTADKWNYTGKFDNQSLELVLKRLAFIKGFRFKIEGKKVNLYN